MKWSEIENAFAIKPDDRSRDEVLTEHATKRSMDESSAHFVSDVMKDLDLVFAQSKTPGEFMSSVLRVLTKGDRGIIFGTLLVVISLSLLAIQNHEPQKNTETLNSPSKNP